MEIFISEKVENGIALLGEEESHHCVRVLRHKPGDRINVTDGLGRLYSCIIKSAGPKETIAQIIETQENWGSHPYFLRMAVCPTKNIDRYEWFLEKACEIGVDEIVPIIGEHSERRIFKPQRAERILVAAAKQSLKGKIPTLAPQISLEEFILACANSPASPAALADSPASTALADAACANSPASPAALADSLASPLRLIACCFEDEAHPRISITEALAGEARDITILIGPEGDFSEKELALAIKHGFRPVHLGPSRLRTETAALHCVSSVYSRFH